MILCSGLLNKRVTRHMLVDWGFILLPRLYAAEPDNGVIQKHVERDIAQLWGLLRDLWGCFWRIFPQNRAAPLGGGLSVG